MARKRDEAAFQAKKTEIRIIAESLFAERGFHQTGIAAICQGVGMSPGALYRYYPSKTDIIRDIVENDYSESVATLAPLKDAQNFRGALLDFMAASIETVTEERYARLALEIAAEAPRDPVIGALLAAGQKDFITHLADAIEVAQTKGQVSPQIDVVATATLLLAIIDGATGMFSPLARFRPTLERLIAGLLPPPG